MDLFALWIGRIVIGFSCAFAVATAILWLADRITNRIWRKLRSTHDLLLLKSTLRQLQKSGKLKLTEEDAD